MSLEVMAQNNQRGQLLKVIDDLNS